MEDLNDLLKTKGCLNAKLGTKYELWRKGCCTGMLIWILSIWADVKSMLGCGAFILCALHLPVADTSQAVVSLAASSRRRNTPWQHVFYERARHHQGKCAEGGECSHQGLLQLLGLSLCTVSVTKQSSPSGHLMQVLRAHCWDGILINVHYDSNVLFLLQTELNRGQTKERHRQNYRLPSPL